MICALLIVPFIITGKISYLNCISRHSILTLALKILKLNAERLLYVRKDVYLIFAYKLFQINGAISIHLLFSQYIGMSGVSLCKSTINIFIILFHSHISNYVYLSD